MALKLARKLSGGQKSRVAFAIMTYKVPHIIVMDEPTNHLDMETIDALIHAVMHWSGGFVVVSHDVHFMRTVCKELWLIEEGEASRYNGSILDYKKHVLKQYQKKNG